MNENVFVALHGVLPGEIELKRRIGVGGLSDVWLAGCEYCNVEFVVKYCKYFAESNDFMYSQYEREYETSEFFRRFGHVSCVLPVVEFGVDVYRHPYLYEAYFASESLASKMAYGVDWGTACEILRKIVKNLHEIHRCGVVHRDIKPGNILVNSCNDIKIIDFSFSQIDGKSHDCHVGNIALGTPYYLSPEQARCERQDNACDWYALGILLYEWLTGGLPYCGGSVQETLKLHCEGKIPNVKNKRLLGAPERLCGIVRMLMAKDPKARFEGVSELELCLG